MMRGLFSLYSWRYPTVLVYMLQNTEYHVGPYLKWYWQTIRFDRVMYRRQLERTRPARLLLLALRLGILLQLAIGGWLMYQGLNGTLVSGVAFGAAVVIAYPVVWAHLVVLPLELGRLLLIKPRQRRLVRKAKPVFTNFKGIKIAVYI